MGEMWANVLFRGHGRPYTGKQVRDADPRQISADAPQDRQWIGTGKDMDGKDMDMDMDMTTRNGRQAHRMRAWESLDVVK